MASLGPVIIDCDVGVDDAVAIALCVAHGLDLVAVTCVHGNTSTSNVIQNTKELLKVLNKSEVPIYKGSEKSFLGTTFFAHGFHGEGGLGGVSIPTNPEGDVCQPEHAVTALLRITREYPEEISLLAIGPLTNVALAIRMDPGFTKRLKKLVIMGGNISDKTMAKYPKPEFNFYCDPEAAHVVLQEAECPILVIPFEACYNTPLPWDWYDSLSSNSSTACRFLGDITNNSALRQKKEIPGFVMCDALAAAVLMDETLLIEEAESTPVHIERNGHYTRGQMMQVGAGMTRNESTENMGPNITIVTKCNAVHFKKLMTELMKL